MKQAFTVLIVLAMVAGANIKTSAQDIETLWDIEVTTASKTSEKLSDAPGIISVVTKQEIEGYGAISLEDVINRVSSMYFMHGGIFVWNLGSIRGQYTSDFDNHVLILINGRPVRDGMSGGFNSIIYNGFPLDIVDRIEIIRGPGSVLYGTNAFSGVINIITSKPKDGESQYNANVQYGSYNTFTQSVSGSAYINEDFDINFAVQNFMDDGPEFEFYDAPFPAYGIPSQSGKGKFTKTNKSVFLNMNYKGLHFNGFYNDADPFTLALPFNWQLGDKKAGDEINKYYRVFGDLGYTHEFNDKYAVDLNVTYNFFRAHGHVDGDHNPDALKGLSKVTLVEGAFKANPIENLNIIVGGLMDYNNFGGAQMQDNSISKINAYVQADYRLSQWLKLIAGAQLNKPEKIDAHISPRLGAVANLNENWGAKVLYSTAFRDAYPIESYVNHPSYEGNIYLKPELISTIDAQVFYQTENIQTSLTYYNSHMSDLVRTVPYDSVRYQFQNIGEFDFQGIEFEGNFKLSQNFSLNSSFIFQENKDDNGEKGKAYWPNTIVKVGVLYKSKLVNAGLFNSFFGEPGKIENPFVVENNPEANAYNLLSANVSFDILKAVNSESKKALLISVFADNLLGEDIWFPEFVRQSVNTLPLHSGRAFYGKLTFKF
jgi:outer membrane cobalamin receptor